MRRLGTLYHLAETSNLPSILAHGLRSTERLLALAGIDPAERGRALRTHRPANRQLAATITIRDQRPMPPNALAPALTGGLEPADWYALLNGFVFLWPERARMDRQLGACGGRPQTVLRFDAAALLAAFGDHAFLSPINSGNARRRAAPRGPATFVPYRVWAAEGWPDGARSRPPAELVFGCDIPAAAPFLLDYQPAVPGPPLKGPLRLAVTQPP